LTLTAASSCIESPGFWGAEEYGLADANLGYALTPLNVRF